MSNGHFELNPSSMKLWFPLPYFFICLPLLYNGTNISNQWLKWNCHISPRLYCLLAGLPTSIPLFKILWWLPASKLYPRPDLSLWFAHLPTSPWPHLLPLPPCPLSSPHSAYELPLQHATCASTPGPLHSLFPLPGAPLPQISAWLTSSLLCSNSIPSKKTPWLSYLKLAIPVPLNPLTTLCFSSLFPPDIHGLLLSVSLH